MVTEALLWASNIALAKPPGPAPIMAMRGGADDRLMHVPRKQGLFGFAETVSVVQSFGTPSDLEGVS